MATCRYGLLFIPYLLALLFRDDPSVSYVIAWAGSALIMYLTLAGKVKPLPGGGALARQLFRPVGLTQLLFAGYTALSSIFYFLDINGYFYLTYNPLQVASVRDFELAAAAQRYYVLAHASFSAGMLAFMDYRRSGEWKIHPQIDLPWFLLYVAVGLHFAVPVLSYVPGVGQVLARLGMLSFTAAVLSFALSIVQKRPGLILASGIMYGYNLLQALTSGWKTEVLISFLLLAIFLYPAYKRTVMMLAPVCIAILLAILPMYAKVVRDLSWKGDMEAQQAAQTAFDQTLDGDAPLAEVNWSFLRGRLSEISMFAKYITYVPEDHPYYGLELVKNGLIGLVPRVAWSNKPDMEALTMQRVYDAGIVEEHSNVSAKPKFVVDAYLSGGALGVFIGFLLYGATASWASRLAERWFGGYVLGSGLVYTAFFREFWMSNSFEFFFNVVVWSFILMGLLFVAGRFAGLIVHRRRYHKEPA